MSSKNRKTISLKHWQKRLPKSPNIDLDQIPYKTCVYTAFAINILVIILIFVLKKHLPPQVPLYYGLARGEQQLAENIGLSFPSLISSLILVTNLTLAYLLKDNFLQKILVISGLASSILATIAVTKIIFLVGSF